MNSFINPHNGVSLTGVIDVTAHSISLFQEMTNLKMLMESSYIQVIYQLLNHMMFRLMNWEIILLLCASLLVQSMVQKLVD